MIDQQHGCVVLVEAVVGFGHSCLLEDGSGITPKRSLKANLLSQSPFYADQNRPMFVSFRMIRSLSLVPCIHVICFANSIVIGAAEYASFSVPASALQRPVPNATKIKNASVRVGFVRVFVHHSRWKTPISLQFNF